MRGLDTVINQMESVMRGLDTVINQMESVMRGLDTVINQMGLVMRGLDTPTVITTVWCSTESQASNLAFELRCYQFSPPVTSVLSFIGLPLALVKLSDRLLHNTQAILFTVSHGSVCSVFVRSQDAMSSM